MSDDPKQDSKLTSAPVSREDLRRIVGTKPLPEDSKATPSEQRDPFRFIYSRLLQGETKEIKHSDKPATNEKRPSLLWRILRSIVFIIGAGAIASSLYAICTPGLRPHFSHWLYRWIVASTTAAGTNPLGFTLLLSDAVVVLLVTASDTYMEHGWGGMLKSLNKDRALRGLRIALICTLLIYGPVFAVYGIKTIYEDHQILMIVNQTLRNEKRDTERQRDSYKKEVERIPGLEQQITDLEKRVSAKPTVVTRTVQVPVAGQIDEAEKKKHLDIRNKLGTYLAGANSLRQLCLTKPPLPEFSCQNQVNQWFGNIILYLDRNLEKSYRARFEAASGNFLIYDNASSKEDNVLVNQLKYKIDILEQFIREFRD